MLKLLTPLPEWKDVLPGVRVQFRPPTIKAMREARAAVARARADGADNQEAGDLFSLALLRHAIAAWDGIGDEAGAPVEPTPETVEQFIADPRVFDILDAAYVWPIVMADMEGNASPPSPAGTGAEAVAASNIASFPVNGTATGDVRPIKKRGTKVVRTCSTSSRLKKAKGSGK